MDASYVFDEYDVSKALKYAKDHAKGVDFEELKVVLSNALKDIRNLPTLNYSKGNTIVFKDYIEKWVNKYINGYMKRPSLRIGGRSTTYPDSIIKTIVGIKFPNLSQENLNKIEAGHSVMMSIENMVGDLLEEYLSIKLKKYGWYCCWGSTIDAVDFCHKNGGLLQVKNSDNSENSSSHRVRNGTEIKKWARRASAKRNEQYWDELNSLIGCKDLSEEDFHEFISNTINSNPDCFYVDDDNPLLKHSQDVIRVIRH